VLHTVHGFRLSFTVALEMVCSLMALRRSLRASLELVSLDEGVAPPTSEPPFPVSSGSCCRRLEALQLFEHVVTSSQHRSHFLRHINGRSQTTHTFDGRSAFATPCGIKQGRHPNPKDLTFPREGRKCRGKKADRGKEMAGRAGADKQAVTPGRLIDRVQKPRSFERKRKRP
jgi:hypothetical protein